MVSLIKKEPKSSELKKYVSTFWAAKINQKNDFYKMLLPVTSDDVILYSKNPIEYHFKTSIRKVNYPFFQGPRSESIYLSHIKNNYVIGVTFKIFHSLTVSPKDLINLKNTICKIDIVSTLDENIDLKKDQIKLEEILIDLIDSKKAPNKEELQILVGVLNYKSNIKNFCNQYGVNIKRIERLFIKYTGFTPKQFIKINKIKTINNIILNKDFTSLTCLAHDMEYYDHAHMVKDFKSIHSLQPKVFIDDSFTIKAALN